MEYTTVEDAIAGIRAFARKHKLENARLAELAGLSKNTLVGLHTRDDWSPSTTTLRALNKVMTEYRE